MALLIKTDGKTKIIKPKDGKLFSLFELNDYVGGYIEMCYAENIEHPLVKKHGGVIICNEEGKIHGLSYNRIGTEIQDNPCDYIVGNCVLLKRNQIL